LPVRNNNPATGKLTAMKWSVSFESKGLFFQTDELHMMTLPKLEDIAAASLIS